MQANEAILQDFLHGIIKPTVLLALFIKLELFEVRKSLPAKLNRIQKLVGSNGFPK